MTDTDDRARRSRLRQRLRRWWPIVFAAIALLGVSELLWVYQSWPVRELLETGAGGTQ